MSLNEKLIMEKELNVAAILKEKPTEIKLYDVLRNIEVRLYDVFSSFDKKQIIQCVATIKGSASSFKYNCNGTMPGYINGMQILKPSKQMQDWSKFAWKKGDVLEGLSSYSIFVEYEKDSEYARVVTDFLCGLDETDIDYDGGESSYPTSDWSKVSDEKAKEIIAHIEKCLGGKLNLETLTIEYPKPEFKDGDILHNDETSYSDETIFIAKISDGIIGTYAYLDKLDEGLMVQCDAFEESEIDAIRLATEEEKQQLFSALEKEGKRWNPDIKTIEDLPKKCEFKAFDKVLAKFDKNCEWMPDFFYYYDKTDSEMPYVCIANGRAIECIPYNEETAHLLGTTNEWEGGEG